MEHRVIQVRDARRGDEVAFLGSDGPGEFHRVISSYPHSCRGELWVLMDLDVAGYRTSYQLRPTSQIACRDCATREEE